jgi:hypothetical protein
MFLIKQLISMCFLIILSSFSLNGFSQIASSDTLPSSAATVTTNTHNHFIPKKLDFGIQVGSQFSTSSYGTGFSTLISPHLTYGLSKRFSISGGISIINTSLNGISSTPLSLYEYPANGNFTNAIVYLSGQYLVSDRLTISGTAYKTFNLFGDTPGKQNYGMNDAQGFYMNVRYKVLKNVHIEAGFGYSKGYNPYNVFTNDPFSDQFGNPFYRPIH